ncbi:hypothetical protein [Streptomyces sp. NPDC055287]
MSSGLWRRTHHTPPDELRPHAYQLPLDQATEAYADHQRRKSTGITRLRAI